MLVKTLLEVVPFDYLQLVAFENDTKTVAWHLLYSNGSKARCSPEADVVLDDTPIAWVHESQQALVTADWSEETRFAKHGEFLNELGIASTCVLPLARGRAPARCAEHWQHRTRMPTPRTKSASSLWSPTRLR